MAYRTEKKMIDVSVTVDAGTSKEYSKKMTIPANSTIIVDIQNTDGKFYMDPECTKEATWDRISDIAFYLKTVDEN